MKHHVHFEDVALLRARNIPPGGEATLSAIVSIITQRQRNEKRAIILDIGCNTGFVTEYLAEHFPSARLVGVDVTESMIRAARSRYQHDAVSSSRICYELLDIVKASTRFSNVDVVVSGGSTAFFSDLSSSLKAIHQILRPGGLFIDSHYIYEDLPNFDLIQREREQFGIAHSCKRASFWIKNYLRDAFIIDEYTSLPPFTLEKRREGSALIKKALKARPALKAVISRIERQQETIRQLEPLRKPCLFVLRKENKEKFEPAKVTPEQLKIRVGALKLMRSLFPRVPLKMLFERPQWYWMAYIGEPLTTPEGAKGVARISKCLQSLGLQRDARILDCGCFTGMSTLMLSKDWDNVLGIDIIPEFISTARRLNEMFASKALLKTRDGAETRFSDAAWSAYILTGTLGYCESRSRLLNEARRILVTGGYLVEYLYDYTEPLGEDSIEQLRNISNMFDLRGLVDQIAEIEGEGFSLVKMEGISKGDLAVESDQSAVLYDLTESFEMLDNPHFSTTDKKIFSRMLKEIRTASAFPYANVYLCVFRKLPLSPIRAHKENADS